jgi:hypothetical protein
MDGFVLSHYGDRCVSSPPGITMKFMRCTVSRPRDAEAGKQGIVSPLVRPASRDAEAGRLLEPLRGPLR